MFGMVATVARGRGVGFSWPRARRVQRRGRVDHGILLSESRHLSWVRRSSSEENISEVDGPTYEELEAQALEFMKQQSALETGEDDEPSVSYDVTQQEFGTDEVSDEEAERYVEESLELLKLLLKNRDMTLNEVKLILAIEDPRAQEARRVYGIEDESGVSREEIAECLMDVSERRSIGNRIALRELWRELGNWPGLLEEEESVAATTPRDESAQEFQAPVGGELAKPAANPKVGRGLEDDLSGGAQTSLTDLLPDWMGYGVLYSFSIVPIIITVVAIAILWVNSFSG